MTFEITGRAARWLSRLAAILLAVPAFAADLSRDPLLMIDSGGHTALVRSLLFTKDGARIVSAADDKTIRVWDWRAGKTERQIFVPAANGEFGKVYALALSPDEKWLAVASEARPHCDDDDCIVMRLYDFATGKIARVFRDPDRNVIMALDFSPDGRRILSGGQDGSVLLWDVEGDRPPRKFEGHDSDVYGVRFLPDGKRIASASDDMTARIWNVETGEALRTFEAGSGTDLRMAISPRGDRIAAGASTGRINVWSIETGDRIREIGPMANVIGALAFDQSGEFLMAGIVNRSDTEEAPTIWRVSDGAKVRDYRAQLGETVNVARLSPDGAAIATAGTDGAVHVWDWRTGQGLRVLEGVGRRIWSVDLGEDGSQLSWGTLPTGAFGALRGPVSRAMTLPHRTWYWNYGLGAPHDRRSARPDGLAQRATTPEHPRLSLKAERGGRFGWEYLLVVRDGDNELARIERSAWNGFRHTAFGLSPAADSILSGGDNGMLVRYGLDGEQLANYDGHVTTVWSVAAARDGLMASGGEDQTVRLWNMASGAPLTTLFAGVDGSWAMWTPQGYFAGSKSGARRVGWLVNEGFETAPRYFRADEMKGLERPDLVQKTIETRSPLDLRAEGVEPLAQRIAREIRR
ncbi:MAG: WD40 repeat domain-containing protein [Rhodoblastus sp.]